MLRSATGSPAQSILSASFPSYFPSFSRVLLCTEGELHTELEDGRKFTLKPGMSYQVADNAEPHRSHTELGAKLFIVD